MDDTTRRNTGGKFRMIPIFENAVRIADHTKGVKIMMGSGADGSTYAHGTQALDFEMLVKRSGSQHVKRFRRNDRQRRGPRLARSGRFDREGKYADVIAVAGDPVADITQLETRHLRHEGWKGSFEMSVHRGSSLLLLCVFCVSVASSFDAFACGSAMRSRVSADGARRVSETQSSSMIRRPAPLMIGFRQTENAIVVRPGNGLWKTMTGLGAVQRKYLDRSRAGRVLRRHRGRQRESRRDRAVKVDDRKNLRGGVDCRAQREWGPNGPAATVQPRDPGGHPRRRSGRCPGRSGCPASRWWASPTATSMR